VNIKLDENFDARLVAVLAAEGHDTDTVSSESLAGSDDDTIYATCRSNGRVLITHVVSTSVLSAISAIFAIHEPLDLVTMRRSPGLIA
jgi:predicted nuclease of predicted toxin-antitoxin system